MVNAWELVDLGLPLWSTGHPGLRELPPLGLLAACSLTLANYKLAQETVSESMLRSTTTAVSPTGQLKTQQLLALYQEGFHFPFGERQMEAGSGCNNLSGCPQGTHLQDADVGGKPCCCIFLSHASRANPTLLLTLSARMKVPHQGDLRQGLRMHNGHETTHPFLTKGKLLKSSLKAKQFYSSQSLRQQDQGDASQGSCLLNGSLQPNMQSRCWGGASPVRQLWNSKALSMRKVFPQLPQR